MPNQINSENTPKTYNAGDMLDAYSLAESDLKWMTHALGDLLKKFTELEVRLGKEQHVPDFYFNELKTFIHMYEYLADNRLNHHEKEAAAYLEEYEANKKAVAL